MFKMVVYALAAGFIIISIAATSSVGLKAYLDKIWYGDRSNIVSSAGLNDGDYIIWKAGNNGFYFVFDGSTWEEQEIEFPELPQGEENF